MDRNVSRHATGAVAPAVDSIDSLRAENARLRKELTELERRSKQYLQNVAHQLNAPLSAIRWNVESLTEPGVKLELRQKALRYIVAHVREAVHQVNKFTYVSKLDSEHEFGANVTREPLDMRALVTATATDYQPQALVGEKKIEVGSTSFRDVLGGSKVMAAKDLVMQALSNLVENAVKYSDAKSTITIFARRIPFKDSARAGLGITVVSDGIPISSGEIPQLQDRSFRGKEARQKVPAGTGIGLYIVRKIMESHKGSVQIEARGKESRFTLIFPPDLIS